jgi:intracellular septation protein
MKNLFHAASFLLLDLASTFVFLVLILVTKNVPLSIVAGMVFGVAQIGWEFARKKPVSVMQWLSLFLVITFGIVSLVTNDPRFVMIKPSLIYIIVGVVMLKPGWMNRYLPEVAMEVVPDIAVIFGFIWAALMFFSAGLNIYLALKLPPATWAAVMSTYGLATKFGLFGIQYATMRLIGVRRRRRAELAPAMA